MNREKELVKNSAILAIGRFLPKLTSFITLPILTACLTKAEYGTADLINTLVMLVIPIATLQIQSAAFRFLIDCRNDSKRTNEIISNIFFVTIPVSIIASIVVQFFFITQSVYTRTIIAVYFVVDTVYLTLGQIARGIGNNRSYSIASAVVSFSNMLGIILMVKIQGSGLLGVVLSLCLANALACIYLDISNKIFQRFDKKLVTKDKIIELLRYSWPMVPNNLSTWILSLSDRLVITAILGVEANAVYAVANKIPSLLSIAQSVLVMAWHENASIAVKDKDATEYYSKMLDKTFSLLIGCTALLISATPIIFKILIHEKYDEAYYQMPILILAMFFYVMSSYFGGIYIAHKKTTNVGISTMIAAAINLAIDLLFVRIIGIWAGSVSTLIAYMILYYFRMFNSQKFQITKVNHIKQIGQLLLIVVMLLICFMRIKWLNYVNALLGICFFFILCKDILFNVRKKVIAITRKQNHK